MVHSRSHYRPPLYGSSQWISDPIATRNHNRIMKRNKLNDIRETPSTSLPTGCIIPLNWMAVPLQKVILADEVEYTEQLLGNSKLQEPLAFSSPHLAKLGRRPLRQPSMAVRKLHWPRFSLSLSTESPGGECSSICVCELSIKWPVLKSDMVASFCSIWCSSPGWHTKVIFRCA